MQGGLGRKTMEMALSGKRKRGGPKTRWKDCLRNDKATVRATDEKQKCVEEYGPHGNDPHT